MPLVAEMLGQMRRIAEFYQFGWGLERDNSKALEYYKSAVEAGDTEALQRIGCRYYHGQGVVQDCAEAREFFTRAGNIGIAEALKMLGELQYCVEENYGEDFK